jgi:hypothetical protein
MHAEIIAEKTGVMTDSSIKGITYTPAELSYLLAGFDSAEARHGRNMLGLAQLHEGDPGILRAVQSLANRGLVTVDASGDPVDIAFSAKLLGYALGTGTDWTRLMAQVDGRLESVVVVESPGTPGVVILRTTPAGNFEALATNPNVGISDVVGALVRSYPTSTKDVIVSVTRDAPGLSGALIAEHVRGTDDWTVGLRATVPGADDIAPGVTEIVTEATFYSHLDQLTASTVIATEASAPRPESATIPRNNP